jgi:hypothetical protein
MVDPEKSPITRSLMIFTVAGVMIFDRYDVGWMRRRRKVWQEYHRKYGDGLLFTRVVRL